MLPETTFKVKKTRNRKPKEMGKPELYAIIQRLSLEERVSLVKQLRADIASEVEVTKQLAESAASLASGI